MILVLIYWRIKPTDKDIADFKNWWKTEAKISDEGNLIGEFLSEPLPASQFNFAVNDLPAHDGEPPHKAFVNVGMWKDLESFHAQVGHNFRDDKPPMDFEAVRRTRTILEPGDWRRGQWQLPESGTCD